MLVMNVAWYRGLAALAKTDPSPCSPTAMMIFFPGLVGGRHRRGNVGHRIHVADGDAPVFVGHRPKSLITVHGSKLNVLAGRLRWIQPGYDVNDMYDRPWAPRSRCSKRLRLAAVGSAARAPAQQQRGHRRQERSRPAGGP